MVDGAVGWCGGGASETGCHFFFFVNGGTEQLAVEKQRKIEA